MKQEIRTMDIIAAVGLESQARWRATRLSEDGQSQLGYQLIYSDGAPVESSGRFEHDLGSPDDFERATIFPSVKP